MWRGYLRWFSVLYSAFISEIVIEAKMSFNIIIFPLVCLSYLKSFSWKFIKFYCLSRCRLKRKTDFSKVFFLFAYALFALFSVKSGELSVNWRSLMKTCWIEIKRFMSDLKSISKHEISKTHTENHVFNFSWGEKLNFHLCIASKINVSIDCYRIYS